MDIEKQFPSADAITEGLKTANDTAMEDTGEARSSQSRRNNTSGLDNAPQGSDDDQMGLARWLASLLSGLQACDRLSVNQLGMKLASDADVLGMRLMAAFVGGERSFRMTLISVKQIPVREVWP